MILANAFQQVATHAGNLTQEQVTGLQQAIDYANNMANHMLPNWNMVQVTNLLFWLLCVPLAVVAIGGIVWGSLFLANKKRKKGVLFITLSVIFLALAVVGAVIVIKKLGTFNAGNWSDSSNIMQMIKYWQDVARQLSDYLAQNAPSTALVPAFM